MEIVQVEGARQVTRSVDFYNLDAIISVGYRVNSRRATQFRIWATSVLKEFIKKGFIVLPATIMLTYAGQALLRVRSPACPHSICPAYKNPYSSNLFCKEFRKSSKSLSCGRRISANQSASAKAA
ncbi:MAG TPA: virulence RhuM family protein [Candidatus Caccalectryoclostridium excrementigallinarum]|uniref:Virulence RhuM family protein n=1 Tax=Candidatus Caccalectryoclostridium excrementigallinarum TaxID=2840710 RepID=A0A9D1SKK1_9FIRM|nr:virulence RhuM family protein [Candidatus Caccalectryoclostridium excrementigallinarum]